MIGYGDTVHQKTVKTDGVSSFKNFTYEETELNIAVAMLKNKSDGFLDID